MTNNRYLIDDFDIVRPQQLLDKGLPLPFLSGKYTVEEGWCAVITEGGAFKEILKPGTHFLGKYHLFRDVKAIAVDTRIQTLSISTQGEFTIARPTPVEIDLDLAVEYRVSDPRRVALEIKTPLTSLYDRVLQAVRGAVVHATIDEVRTQGEGLAQTTLHRLQAMQLPKAIGIEVFNVLVTSIRAAGAGQDVLAQQQLKEFTTARDWQLDTMMISQSKVTPEWLMVHRPEIYQQLLAGNQALLKEMIDKGLLDPAGFLAQTAGSPSLDLTRLLGNFGMPGAPSLPGMGGGTGSQQPQLSNQPAFHSHTSDAAARTRIEEEIDYLKKMAGADVEMREGTDAFDRPDGSCIIRMAMPRSSGGQIVLYFSCPVGYPSSPPRVDVEIDGEPTPFQSGILQRWIGQYLVEIAREAKQRFG